MDGSGAFEGVYRGRKEVRTKRGPAVLHLFENDRGEGREAWGTSQLTMKLSGIGPGVRVRIRQTGRTHLGNRRWMNTYDVDVWTADE